MVMTRLRMLFVLLLGGLLAGSGLFAGAAGAASATPTLTAAYPPVVCATLTVSTTVPVAGQTITIGGTDFDPGDTVQLTLVPPGTVLATVTVAPDGTFTADVMIPASAIPGKAEIQDIATTTKCPSDPISITIGAGATPTATPTPST